jgi:hypothetical protein
MHFLHDAKNRKISKNIVDSEQSICAVAPFRVVAPCPCTSKTAHSILSNCRIQVKRYKNGCFQRRLAAKWPPP